MLTTAIPASGPRPCQQVGLRAMLEVTQWTSPLSTALGGETPADAVWELVPSAGAGELGRPVLRGSELEPTGVDAPFRGDES